MKKRILLTFAASAMLLAACGKTENTVAEPPAETTAETSSAAVSEAVTETSKPDFRYMVYEENGVSKAYVKEYLGNEVSVAIPEEIGGFPVIRYAPGIFKGTDVSEAVFPPTVTKILDINGADKLETLNISKTVKMFSANNFSNCASLKNVNAEKGETFMSVDGVLYSADGKSLVFFPPGRTGEFTVPDGVEFIGDYAFSKSGLTKVTLPQGLSEIGGYAFRNSELEEITLPDGLETIEKYTFSGSKLKNVVLPAGLAKIDGFAFQGCPIKSIDLPEGLTEIGMFAFSDTELTELYLPDSIESCGDILGNSSGIAVSAPISAAYGEGSLHLTDLPNITFRGDNDMHRAVRSAPKLYDHDAGRIFIDLDGDCFPEIITVGNNGGAYGHQYDFRSKEWHSFWYGLNTDKDLNLYYDKDRNEYFYLFDMYGENGGIFFYKYLCSEDGFYNYNSCDFSDYIGLLDGYSAGEWTDCGGERVYSVESTVEFGTINGKYYIGIDDPDFLKNAVNDAMKEYEIVSGVNISEIVERYGDDDRKYEIVMSEFAEKPQPSPYFSEGSVKWEDKEPLVTIGGSAYTEDDWLVYLQSEEVTAESFEKLSRLPKLTTLSIGGRYGEQTDIDLNGIGALTDLRELYVYGNIKNAAEIGKLTNLSVLYMSPEADDLSFLTGMDSVAVIEFGNTMDKPADFYEPISGMKNLRCFLLSRWEQYMTEEQEAYLRENAPQIKIFTYKRG